MTTIAVRDGVMACDSLADGEYSMTVDKVYPLPDGGFVGGAGGAVESLTAIHWLQGGCEGDCPVFDGENAYFLLILRGDGTIWRAEGKFPAFRILDKFAAIGSGSNLAMAAMEMGATAAEAVKVAAKYDTGTGGRVRSFALPAKRSRK